MKNKSILVSFLLIAVFLLSITLWQKSLAQSYNSLTTSTTNTTTTGTSFTPTYANSRWSEDTMRAYFNQYGVTVNGGATVYGLGNFAITGIVSFKKTVDFYTNVVRGPSVALSHIVITRGTETYGMDTPVLDIQSDPAVDYFITTLATNRGGGSSGTLYHLGDDYFFQTNGYWHVIFGPSNGAFVKNTITFFGIVRDNFNIPHPTLSESTIPTSINFSRTLNLGSTGQDVKDLQKLLNTDPYTLIASSGVGSPGSETNYFGTKTQAAVKRYQYKNNEILDAAGVTTPTGIVGPFSRASFGAYWAYLNSVLRGQGHSAAVGYPTPTKPLQDIPFNATTTLSLPGTGTPSATTTTLGVNVTPTAPPYTGSYGNLPIAPGVDPNLNSTPVFNQDPTVNGNNVSDPNNSANTSANSSQPSPLQSLLPSILQIASRFLLSGGLSKIGGTGLSKAPALPDFGGQTLYNSNFDYSQYKPCGVTPTISVIVNDNSAKPTGIKPIVLFQTPATQLISGTPPLASCVLGNYSPTSAVSMCQTKIRVNNQDVIVNGTAGALNQSPLFKPFSALPLSGTIIMVNQSSCAS